MSNRLILFLVLSVAALSSNAGIITDYRINALNSGAMAAQNTITSWSHPTQARIQGRNGHPTFYMGTNNRTYGNGLSNHYSGRHIRDQLGFEAFDNSLGNIVNATLHFDFSYGIVNFASSLEWHYRRNAYANSRFDFGSFVTMNDANLGTQQRIAAHSGGTPTIYCNSHSGVPGPQHSIVRRHYIGDGDDMYCSNAWSQGSARSLSVQVDSQYFTAIENEDFSLLLDSHINNWSLNFGYGDDMRFGRATVDTIVRRAYLSIDYDDGISVIAPPTVDVSEPGSLALLGLGLAGLSLTRRKSART